MSIFFSMLVSAQNYQQETTAFNFEDISSTGELLIENCDDCARAVEIGFEFTYYGRVYTQLYVGSNGFVLPGGSNPNQGERMACCDGRDIPWKDNMEGVIALWWTDLSLKAQKSTSVKEEKGKIYYHLLGSPGDYVLVIQFDKVRHFHNLATDDSNTFELKIFQNDNHLEFHYKNLVANKNIHTIGIESPLQNQGIRYFRTSKATPLPSKTKNFAISFIPPESVKLTSSLRYGAEGNKLDHVFEVNQNVSDIADIDFTEFEPSGSLAEDIDFGNATLLSNNPARFSLKYTLFSSLSGEKAGGIFGDIIDFTINGGDFLSLESQTIFIGRSKLIDDDEAKINGVSMNHNATMLAYKSKNNLLNVSGKSVLAGDVFFSGRDPDTLAGESYQLTRLGASGECGTPYIDDGDEYSYLFVICTTGGANKEVELIRYDLASYLDDDLTPNKTIVAGSTHEFSGSISQQALVVSASGSVAYGKDVGAGLQNVNFNGNIVNSTTGQLKSLSINSAGDKLVYVLDNTLYFYNGAETIITSEGVESAHISSDGSLIAFNSTSNALDASDNSDNSLEIFTVPAEIPFANFQQKTMLAGGECKLPVLSEHGRRIIVICNGDLLNLGNNFSNREAVFVIEKLNENEVVHLISGKSNVSKNISDLTMSSDGASVVFEDADEENAFSLTGLSKLDSRLEENTSKNYPVPFKLAGDGKSGTFFFINIFLLIIFLVRGKFLNF